VELKIVQPSCEVCSLSDQKKVWGEGKTGGIVIVGEAPGRDEAREGRPFVGQSGKLLKTVLDLVGIEDYYITNSVLCRTPGNRDPSANELRCCSERLFSEVKAAQPSKILLLGSIATGQFLGKPVRKCRGAYKEWNGIPVIATFHPAAVLYSPSAYRDFYRDIEKLLREPKSTDFVPEYKVLNLEESLTYLSERCERGGKLALDIETSSFYPHLDYFICVGMSHDGKTTYIIENDVMLNPTIATLLEKASERCKVVCHNGDFETRWLLHKFGIKLKIEFDTILAHHAIDERSADEEFGMEAHSLKVLGGHYLDLPEWEDEMLPYKGNYALAPREILYKYLAYDIYATWELEGILRPELDEEGLRDVFFERVMPAQSIIAEMSDTGVLIDWKYITNLEDKIMEDVQRETLEVCEELNLDPKKFNVRSNTQMPELLFDRLGLPEVRGRSTGKKVINELLRDYDMPVLQKIGMIRRRLALISTNVRGLIDIIRDDGRVHTQFLQHGTETGRLASRNPNMQNVPAHFGFGELIRRAYIAPPGWEFLEIDYKQLEARTACIYFEDPQLISYFQTGRDIHREAASLYFNVPPEEVTGDMRHDAKRVVFGIFYGRGFRSISKEYGIPFEEAKRRIALQNDAFPEAVKYRKRIEAQVKQQGYVVSKFGRRRRFPLLTEDNVHECVLQAINFPIQSTASDICLGSLVRVGQKADREIAKPLLIIHDALLLQVRSEAFEETAKWIVEEMQADPFETPVKFLVSCKRGTCWGEMTDFEL